MAQILLLTNNKLMFASCCCFTIKWQMLLEETLAPRVPVLGASGWDEASAEGPGRGWQVAWAAGGSYCVLLVIVSELRARV